MLVRDSLENKPMLLVHFKKAFPLTLLGHSFDRRAAYWLLFCLKVITVFAIPTQTN